MGRWGCVGRGEGKGAEVFITSKLGNSFFWGGGGYGVGKKRTGYKSRIYLNLNKNLGMDIKDI